MFILFSVEFFQSFYKRFPVVCTIEFKLYFAGFLSVNQFYFSAKGKAEPV